MTAPKPRMIFVNLAVHDLPKSVKFFEDLGFEFDPRFCDEKAHCMILGENAAYVMLLDRSFFQTFTTREIADTSRANEALLAISCESREEVDTLCEEAIALGATEAMPPADHGFMRFRTFYDLDGHHWEVMWMDPAGPPAS
jgi:uncharacterized protein